MMLELTEFLIRGALLGAIYGLLAYPVSLLFATTDSVDLAVGAYAVLGASIAFAVGGPTGIVLAVLGTVAVSCVVGVLSMSINRGAPDPLVGVLATFGLATFLDSLVLTIFGKPVLSLPASARAVNENSPRSSHVSETSGTAARASSMRPENSSSPRATSR